MTACRLFAVPKCDRPACLIAPVGKGISVAIVQSREDVVDVAVAGLVSAYRQQQLPHTSIFTQSPIHLGNVRSLQGSVKAVVTGVERACSAWFGCSTKLDAASLNAFRMQIRVPMRVGFLSAGPASVPRPAYIWAQVGSSSFIMPRTSGIWPAGNAPAHSPAWK